MIDGSSLALEKYHSCKRFTRHLRRRATRSLYEDFALGMCCAGCHGEKLLMREDGECDMLPRMYSVVSHDTTVCLRRDKSKC